VCSPSSDRTVPESPAPSRRSQASPSPTARFDWGTRIWPVFLLTSEGSASCSKTCSSSLTSRCARTSPSQPKSAVGVGPPPGAAQTPGCLASEWRTWQRDYPECTRPAGKLSRVALARALASEPKALLLDEPLAALDVEFRDEVRADLGLRLRQFAGPTILVTHDREDVEVLADEVIVLEAGRITQRGSLADLARNPATAWIARFTGAQGRRDADDVRYG